MIWWELPDCKMVTFSTFLRNTEFAGSSLLASVGRQEVWAEAHWTPQLLSYRSLKHSFPTAPGRVPLCSKTQPWPVACPSPIHHPIIPQSSTWTLAAPYPLWRGHQKHSRAGDRGQKSPKGPRLPSGCEFLSLCLVKSNTKLCSLLIFFILRPSCLLHTCIYFSSNRRHPTEISRTLWCSEEGIHMPGSSWYLQKAPFELAFDYTPMLEGGQWDSVWLVSMRKRWWKIAKLTFNITDLFQLSCTVLNCVFLVEREHKLWSRTQKGLENVTFMNMIWVLLSRLYIPLDSCRITWPVSWNLSLFLPTKKINPLIGQ